jgi:arylsulfatase A-like enzyme
MFSLADHTRIPAALLFGPLLGSIMGCGKPPPPSVLIVTVDTLRADHLGTYGSTVTRTPHIDRLAEESVVFEHAAAPMPLTRPSHFSILTSRYPREHGVVNNAMSLPESALTLAEIFSSAGYRTGAFVSVRLLGSGSGAQQGFETFDVPTETQRAAGEVVPRALAWLDEEDERPTFLWLHLFDPHQPYDPPEEYREGLDTELVEHMPAVDWDVLIAVARANDGDVPRRIFEYTKDLYAREVEYADHWIGELCDGLRSRGRMDDTVLVLTADHGEAFENGYFFDHADSLYEGTMHVPLIVRHPRSFTPGTRASGQVSLVDVAPTVLSAAGLDVPRAFSGRPLSGFEQDDERFVLLQHPFYQPGAALHRPSKQRELETVAGMPTAKILVDSERVGIVGGDWKYLRTGEEEELYRLQPVLDEVKNLIDEDGNRSGRLRAALAEALSAHPLNIIDRSEINAQLMETLRELGYVE